MEWINVKDALPENDCTCVVHNSNRPYQYYIATYSKRYDEFEVYMIGCFVRLPDAITFKATHWMKIERPEID